MEAQLSSRMAAMATGAIPKIEASIANKEGKIDLATAESWVIRHELVSLFQDAMANGLNINDLSYPEGFGGPPDLLHALARLFNEHFNPVSPVLPNHIVATTGASLCLDALMFSICEPGDIVLVMAPYFNGLDLHLALRSGCKLVPISATMSIEGANADCQSLWKSVNTNLNEAYEGCADPSKVKALVITNPNNPLGMCYPEEVMRETMFWCGERGIYYVSDEVYALSDFSRGRGQGPTEGGLPKYDLTVTKATPFISALSVDLHDEQAGRNDLSGDAETKMRKILPIGVVWSTSKDLGSSGLRLGVFVKRPVAGSSASSSSRCPLTGSLGLLTTPHLPSITSKLTTALLDSPALPALLSLSHARLRANYDILAQALRSWGVRFVPTTNAPFLFARLGMVVATLPVGGKGHHEYRDDVEDCTWADEENLVAILRDRAGVLVASGKGFHVACEKCLGCQSCSMAGWVRITFGVPEAVLRDALTRMAKALDLNAGWETQ
ncbi:ACC synthase [Apiospora arundinis]